MTNNKIIIGFAGKKQSGKSTAAAELVKSGFTRVSFADGIKDMASLLLLQCGYTKQEVFEIMTGDKELVIAEIGKSLREILQTLGTEWGRELIHSDLWVIVMRNRLGMMADRYLVFDDVRFENEAAMIRDMGGLIVHVDRLCEDVDAHASEVGINNADGDEFIDNDGSLEDFIMDVNLVVAQWIGI